jgi:hypothetical protein
MKDDLRSDDRVSVSRPLLLDETVGDVGCSAGPGVPSGPNSPTTTSAATALELALRRKVGGQRLT